MYAQENKTLVREFVEEAQGRGNIEAVDDYLAADFMNHDAFSGFAPDRDGVKQLFAALHATFEDFRVVIHDQVAEGGKVVTRKTLLGVHQGEFMGVPATGKPVGINVIDMLYVEGGRITDHWAQVDLLGLMRQLGAIPAPETALNG